ncbi:cupin domain-containing protein [Bordetella avium]|uniref:cupin domain-containing protein n=1 Tax=Bordetella avium TaxID=521 RepID=UPI0039FBDE84
MDTLSQLLSLGRIELRPDVRCLLQGAFAMRHEAAQPGEAAFHLLLAGQCRLQARQGPALILNEGDFVLLPHGSAHDLLDIEATTARRPVPAVVEEAGRLPLRRNTAPEQQADVDLLCGRFSYDRGAGDLFARSLPGVLHVPLAHHLPQLQPLIAMLRVEAASPLPGAAAVINALGQALLALALRAYGQREEVPANMLALAADSLIGPSVRAMIQDPGQAWTIETLGNKAAMSRATYARHFRSRAGMTVGEFLLRIRMMHASALLNHSQRSQRDIAEQVGYQSEAAFGKAFREIMGQTPGQWRRLHRNARPVDTARRSDPAQ